MKSRKLIPMLCALTLALLALSGAATAADASVPAGNTGWSWANPLPAGNSIDRIAVSSGRVWAGGATGTLLHSDDGGNTWEGVRTGVLDGITTVEAISPTAVVFAGRCAMRRSDDSGVSVHRLAWGANDESCASQVQAVSFVTPLRGFLLLTTGDVYVTDDGGDNWSKRGVVPGAGAQAVRDIEFTAASTGVVSVGDRIMRTEDAGAHWTPVATVAAGGSLFNFEFLGGEIGFAAGVHGDFLRTIDGGASWEPVGSDASLRAQSITSLSCVSGQSCVATLADSRTILRTENGGQTWSAVVAAEARLATIGFVSESRVVAGGENGALVLSDDAGKTWRSASGSAPGAFASLDIDSPSSATAFGQAGSAARTLDGGRTWNPVAVPPATTLVSLSGAGTNRIFALDDAGQLLRSYDGGANWQVPLKAATKPSALIAWSKFRVGLIGPRGVAISTRSGAAPKHATGPVAQMALGAADRAGRATFFYGKRAIAVTLNKGKSFAAVKRPRRSGSIVKLEMLDAKYGYLLDSKAEVFATKNAGKSWRRLETTGANVAVSMAFGDRKTGYITDNTGRILATDDGGATWARQYPFYDASGKSNVVVAAFGGKSALALASGTNRIFSTIKGGRIGSPSVLTIKPSARRVRSGTVIQITGKLSPATGIEQVAVLARVVGAKGGTKWVSQTRPVSPTGTFSSPWKITANTQFIARWSGDFQHDGDGTPLQIVRLRR